MDDVAKKLQAVQDQMHGCRLCLEAGYEIFPRAIFSGTYGARIMTIGQAPGITEKEAGRPFNAGSGKRLFEWLGKAGIDEDWFRTTQYMTSVTKCYPGRAKGGSGDRVPSGKEQKLCWPFLDREIRLVAPEVVIPIGRLAITLFYDKKLKLTEIIGTQMQLDGGAYVIPLPHSSGASRWHQTQENRELIDQAIQLIAGQYQKLFSNT